MLSLIVLYALKGLFIENSQGLKKVCIGIAKLKGHPFIFFMKRKPSSTVEKVYRATVNPP